MLDELRRALARSKFGRYLSEEQVERLVPSIERAAVAIPDPAEVPSVCRDPKDDYLFALARGVGADVLVSVNEDVLETDAGVRVLTPRGFEEVLRRRWN